MNGLKRIQLVGLLCVLLIFIIAIICFVINVNRNKISDTDSEHTTEVSAEATTDTNGTLNETSTTTEVSSETSTEISFSNNEEIYNYAVSQISQRKYYSAIKYLRKIEGYKDADALQAKVFKLINTDYFEFSAQTGKVIACEGMNAATLASDKVVTRADSSIPNDKIAQRGAYWYLDTDGIFHTVGISTDSPAYKYIFMPIIKYNKTTKFQLISFDDDPAATDSSAHGVILGKDTTASFFTIAPNDKWGPLELFGTYKDDWIEDDEELLYVSGGGAALTNNGNSPFCPSAYRYDERLYISWNNKNITNIVAVRYTGGSVFCLTDEGTVLFDNKDDSTNNYPAITTWNDIISIEYNHFNNYCCGLTSDGRILVTWKGITNTLTPFPADEKFIAITSKGNCVAALSEKGTVYTYTVPKR